jgi:hypothetical protein
MNPSTVLSANVGSCSQKDACIMHAQLSSSLRDVSLLSSRLSNFGLACGSFNLILFTRDESLEHDLEAKRAPTSRAQRLFDKVAGCLDLEDDSVWSNRSGAQRPAKVRKRGHGHLPLTAKTAHFELLGTTLRSEEIQNISSLSSIFTFTELTSGDLP